MIILLFSDSRFSEEIITNMLELFRLDVQI